MLFPGENLFHCPEVLVCIHTLLLVGKKYIKHTHTHTPPKPACFPVYDSLQSLHFFQSAVFHLFTTYFLIPPCVHTGLCSGRLVGWLCDVCQEAARHGPARESDGGGGPASRLPQPVTARQGDGGCHGDLHCADEGGFRAGKPDTCILQTTKDRRDLSEHQSIRLSYLSVSGLCCFLGWKRELI